MGLDGDANGAPEDRGGRQGEIQADVLIGP